MPIHNNIPVPRNQGKLWSKEDREIIVNIAYNSFNKGEACDVRYLSRVLGRSIQSVECQLYILDEVGKEAYIEGKRVPIPNGIVERLAHKPHTLDAEPDIELTDSYNIKLQEGKSYSSLNANRTNTILTNKEKHAMQMNHLLSLLQKNYTTVQVIFQGDENKQYTFKMRKNDYPEINKYVVVPSDKPGKFAVAKVVAVDAEPQINLDSNIRYKWIVTPVYAGEHDKQVAREEEFIKLIEKVSKKKEETRLIKEFKEFLPQDEESQALVEEGVKLLSLS